MHKNRFLTLTLTLVVLCGLLFAAGGLDAKAQLGRM